MPRECPFQFARGRSVFGKRRCQDFGLARIDKEGEESQPHDRISSVARPKELP